MYKQLDEKHSGLEGRSFIDNTRVRMEHLKNRGIDLNGGGVKILAWDIIGAGIKYEVQIRKPQVGCRPYLKVGTSSEQDTSTPVEKN